MLSACVYLGVYTVHGRKRDHMRNPEISVIVPVYQAKDFLKECVESILNQTFRNFECILVDDGSSDLSSQLCGLYAQKDERVRVIHKRNGGVSSARNIGMEAATGRYIEFVDADDWVDERLFETQLRVLREQHAQIAETTICMGTGVCSHALRVENGVSRLTRIFREDDIGVTGYIGWEAFGKLIDTAILNGLRFSPIRIGEDMVFTTGVYSQDPRIATFDERMYIYRRNPNSAMHSMHRRTDPDIVKAVEQTKRIADEHHFSSDDVLAFCVRHLYYYFCDARRGGESAKSPYMQAVRGFIRANFRQFMAQKTIIPMIKTRFSELALLNSALLPFRKKNEENQ